jgi:thiamine pyrophosphokinase
MEDLQQFVGATVDTISVNDFNGDELTIAFTDGRILTVQSCGDSLAWYTIDPISPEGT